MEKTISKNYNNKIDNILKYEHKKYEVEENIQLTELETEIFSIIKNILNKNKKDTICRVAGGWVRDKLLMRKSDDIDIALDNMMGSEIAKMINDELYPGQEKFGVVEKNNEKSKHLETATMKIAGTFIDFVNLRSESYTEDSRVPEIEIGTPEQDAARRDITINSMFYNINTNRVEDFLEKGIKDLKDGIIATPLDPKTTFQDDPLRILRAVRFAVRFQFELDESIVKVVTGNTEIRTSLFTKISNERIQKELTLMLEGNQPWSAVYLLYKMSILDIVLKLPLNIETMKTEEELNKIIKMMIISKYLFNTKINKLKLINSKEDQKSTFYALLSLVFRQYKTKIGKEPCNATKVIIKESLKLNNDLIKEIGVYSTYIDDLIKYIETGKYNRLETGNFIRKIKYPYFNRLLFIAICESHIYIIDEEKDDINIDDKIIEKYIAFIQYIEKENLHLADDMKPVFDGTQIQEILNIKPGKELGILNEYLIEQQIINPTYNEEQFKQLLQAKKQELEILNQNNESETKNKKAKNQKKLLKI